LRISNLQGLVIKNNLDQNRLLLDKLNKQLGENWRVRFTRFLKNYTDNKKINLFMEMPKKAEQSSSEYIRQIRQYIQTALKVGINIKNISLRRINDPKIKERFISNLKLKKTKLLLNKKTISKIKPIIRKR